MDKEEVKKIIKEELANIIKTDRYVFDKKIQILNARNIILGRGTGTQIGTATDQKIGFWGATPVDRPATVDNPLGQEADLDMEARDAITAVIDRLQELGLIA